jgi:hypothetical protein
MDITGILQSIERDRDPSAAKPSPKPEPPGCCGPVQLQHVNRLHVGETRRQPFPQSVYNVCI